VNVALVLVQLYKGRRMVTVNAIAHGLKDYVGELELEDGETIGEFVEDELISACNSIANVCSITEGKIDVDFLLSIVGAYLVSNFMGELPEGTEPPSEIFNTTMVEAMNQEITKEDVEDGSTDNTPAA
jgi:hypothetical protein